MRTYTQPHTETLSVQIATNILNTSAGTPTMTVINGGKQIYAW